MMSKKNQKIQIKQVPLDFVLTEIKIPITGEGEMVTSPDVGYGHKNNMILTSEEMLAAYLSHEKYMNEIVKTTGTMAVEHRLTALLVLQALELGNNLQTPGRHIEPAKYHGESCFDSPPDRGGG